MKDLSPRIRLFFKRYLTPTRMFILSFAGLILLGALLLWLPVSASKGSLRFVDALFMSASAVCVTGLATVDIGQDLSFVGQVVTLALFQIGGLGIITFSVVFFGLMGRSISFKESEIIQATFLHTPRRDFLRIMKRVVLLTLAIEGVGTALLFVRFIQDAPTGKALFQALYHAVSAFNNCGYALFADSLIGFRDDVLVNLTVMGLIVLGGIGLIVQYEVIARLRGRQKRLSVHARIVLLTTACLILFGAVFFYLCEVNNVLRDAPAATVFLTSLFQSVTARTCGFNTVDIGQLTNASILLLMVLMFIGASPGSTGGGIKTTSFTLLLLMIRNRLKGQEQVNVFNRTIPAEILGRTIAIIFASAFAVVLVTSVLLILGGVDMSPLSSRHLFAEYLFESVSAYGTVGLSMNLTAKLNDAQKLAIVFMMFAGRVGPLTLAFAWGTPGRGVTYAEEQVMVG